MKKIRIGNDIVIKWRVTINGEEVNLEGLDLSLYISTTYQPRRAIAFTVAGNEITATYKGTAQKVTGVYRLTLYRNEGENSQSILDACDAFELVSCSCLTVDAAFGGAEVELPVADLGIGVPGLSAYEIALSEGFEGTQEEWLASLSAASEAAAAECREFTDAAKIDERERQNNEALRLTAENERAANERTRALEEQKRVTAELLRASAEVSRKTAEEAREADEQQRSTAEVGRSSAEELRKSNEQSRISEETTRSNNEAARIAAETKRANAELTRKDNEDARQKAERGRVTAETARQSAEADRATNERNRATAEQQRVTNETARKNAESSRATAETARQSAETARQEAEQGRATAEQQRADAEAARAEEFAGFSTAIAAKEDAVNKVTSIGADADDTHYPSAKAVREMVKPLWAAIEDKYWYGIEKDTTVSTPTCTRIGNMELHRTLPVQSLMRGCLLADDGTVNKYLDPDDWTSEVRDGSQGQVMVEIPRHYRKCETDGNIIRVKLSLLPLDGFHEIPKMYVSAYEAALERSTNKLCSVVNDGADYRGGNNKSDWDGTYRSLLGRPVTSISLNDFRAYARNRGPVQWNCYLYQANKVLCWLFAIEYANFNSQAAFNAALDENGYHQGGLGAGVTNMPNWRSYNGENPSVPCGITDSLGNHTGTVDYKVINSDDTTRVTFAVPRYRGVENAFGHISKWADGCKCIIQSEASGALSKFYVCDDPAKFTVSGVGNYDYRGDLSRKGGYVKAIVFGEDAEIMSSEVGGGSSTYFCDYFYTAIQPSGEIERSVSLGGNSYFGAMSGFISADTNYTPSSKFANCGSRLCFIPQK